MATKRMFVAKITCEDDFRCLHPYAQALYLQYGMEADDWGIVGSPIGIMRACAIPEEYSLELERSGFIYRIDGRVVIRHWFVHNSIPEDRRSQTNYPEVLSKLELNDEDVYIVPQDAMCFVGRDRTIPGNPKNPQGLANNSKQNAETCRQNAETCRQNVSDCKQNAETCTQSQCREEEREIDSSFSPPIIPPTPSGAEGTETEADILTDAERERLTAVMGADYLELYLAKMQSFISTNGREYKNPSSTIEKWYREDRKSEERPPGDRERKRKREKESSFETDEFFNAALRKSYEAATQDAGGGD